MSECPFCAEVLPESAQRCHHCGEVLVARPTTLETGRRGLAAVLVAAAAVVLSLCVGSGLAAYFAFSRRIQLQTQLLSPKQQQASDEMAAFLEAAREARIELGRFPSGWIALVGTEAPLDPWGAPYIYEPAEDGVTFRSLGADGVEGGVGEDADLMSGGS